MYVRTAPVTGERGMTLLGGGGTLHVDGGMHAINENGYFVSVVPRVHTRFSE